MCFGSLSTSLSLVCWPWSSMLTTLADCFKALTHHQALLTNCQCWDQNTVLGSRGGNPRQPTSSCPPLWSSPEEKTNGTHTSDPMPVTEGVGVSKGWLVAPANPGADYQATKVTEHARTRVKAKSLFSECNLSQPPTPPPKGWVSQTRSGEQCLPNPRKQWTACRWRERETAPLSRGRKCWGAGREESRSGWGPLKEGAAFICFHPEGVTENPEPERAQHLTLMVTSGDLLSLQTTQVFARTQGRHCSQHWRSLHSALPSLVPSPKRTFSLPWSPVSHAL